MCQDPQEAMLKVSGFKSESRPASRRNAVRLQIGISVRLRRNLQEAELADFERQTVRSITAEQKQQILQLGRDKLQPQQLPIASGCCAC
jgi:hypothetical protein